MEIFTISGSNLRASAAPPVLLQNALKALGATHGDPMLSAVAVDGVIGPATVAATNHALATYIGDAGAQAAGLSGRFLNATATKSDIQQYAGSVATAVTNAVHTGGGTIPDPVVSHRSSGGGGKSSLLPMAPSAPLDNTMNNPNLVWILGGGALVVLALGFMAAKKRAAA